MPEGGYKIRNHVGGPIHSNYSYDDNGNVLSESQNIAYGLQQTNIVYSNYNTNGSWLPNKPELVTTTVTRQGQEPISSSIAFEYYENGGLKKKITHPNLPKKIIYDYEYFSSGNLKKETVSCQDGSFAPKVSEIAYDNKFRFAKEKNIQNEITKYEYESMYGIKTKEIAPSGLITSFVFDNFGQVNYTIDYLGNQLHKARYWVNEGDVPSANVLDNANTALYYEKVWGTQLPVQKTFFDSYERVIISEQQLRENQLVYTQTKYQNGLPFKSTSSYQLSNPEKAIIKTYNYSDVCRLNTTVVQDPNDGSAGLTTHNNISYINGNLKTIIIKPDGSEEIKIYDDSGILIKSTDSNGSIEYDYYSDGKLKNTKVNNILVNTITYNEYRQQTSLWDMSAGTTSYTYDAAGNLKTQTDSRGNTYSFDYNNYNQVETKTGPEGVYSYEYVTNGIAKHALKKVLQPNGNFQEYFFDEYGRVNKTREKIAAETFDFEFDFDQYGNLLSKKYPNGFTIENEYDNIGNLIKIKNQSSGAAIWTLNTLNEQGKITRSTLGSGAQLNQSFTKFGYLNHKLDYLSADDDFLFSYTFDNRNGNLRWRDNLSYGNGITEVFSYENEKLISASCVGSYLQEIEYDNVNISNIKSKTEVGNYTYHPTKKHAVKKVQNAQGIIANSQQNIIFNEQNRAKEIYEGMYKAEFEYNANAHRQSMKMMVTDDPSAANPAYNLSYTRYYAGEYEKQVSASNTTEVCYINTPVGLAAAHVTQNNTSEIFYLHTDHLGSIIGVSNSNQQKIYEVSYDAWGKKRAVEFWFPTNEPQTPPNWLWRGYTGHEHLPEFGLINMNARLYDPLLGRMLSPDNYVANATYSGDFNRYSYARNNPLKYVDPDGNEPVTATALIIAGVIGGTMNVASNWQHIDNFGQGAIYFGIGAGAGIASIFTFGAGGGIVTAVGNGLMQGQDAGTITKNAIIGGVVGLISAGLTYGISSSAPNYDAIGNLAGRYAAKVGYSTLSGFIVGSTASATQQLFSNGGDLSRVDGKQVLNSGIAGGVTSGAISLAYCAYDYATWDRYDGETKVNMLNKKYGGNLKYLSESEYNEKYQQIMKTKYSQNYGLTNPDVSYLTDAGLTSRDLGEMTYMHEARHVAQYRSGVVGATMDSEFAAYTQEFMEVNRSTPSRYVNKTNLGRRDSYYFKNDKSYEGYQNIYNNKFSNRFINIFR